MGACNNKVYLYIDSSKTTKSTQLYGPKPAMEYLLLQRKYLMPIIKKYNGEVIDIVWDSFTAKFDDAMDSVFAALEIRDCYQYHEEFLANREKSKINISGISLSRDREFCDELGENHIEDGKIVVHGEKLIESLSEKVWLYGFEFSAWSAKAFPKESFVEVNRSTNSGATELKNKVILTFFPLCAAKEAAEVLKKYNTFRPEWLDVWIYIFDDKEQALKAGQELFDHWGGKLIVVLNYADEITIHEKLKIISAYGVNVACKIAQDVDLTKPSLRVTSSLFEKAPSDKFKSKSTEVSGVTLNYWERHHQD